MKEITLCPTFYPTEEEFSDFLGYISKIESQCAGMAKIVPPPGWKPRKAPYENMDDLAIKTPIRQYVSGEKGIFQVTNVVEKKEISFANFKKESEKFQPPTEDHEKLERYFWKNVLFRPALYGADLLGSLFDEDVKEWNLRHLKSILDLVDVRLPGITTPYLYFGMFKSLFAIHKEDLDLYSINYLHFGQPKVWYTVAPKDAARFEAFAIGHFPELHKECSQFLRHKTTIITPSMLAAANISVTKAVQQPGEFVITLPAAYHFGFNSGLNCAEAVNFATERWIEIGLRAKPCKCESDTVRIDMPAFVAAYDLVKQQQSSTGSTDKASPSSSPTKSLTRGRSSGKAATTAGTTASTRKRASSFEATEEQPGKVDSSEDNSDRSKRHRKPSSKLTEAYPSYNKRLKRMVASTMGPVVAKSTSPTSSEEFQGDDPELEDWVFSCLCVDPPSRDITREDDPSLHPSGLLFECSRCSRWSHVECYPDYSALPKGSLPTDMFCHRCEQRTVLPRTSSLEPKLTPEATSSATAGRRRASR